MPPCPEHSGLAAAIEALRQEVRDSRQDSREIKLNQERIIKAVCGDLEEHQPGLLHRVKTLEERDATRARILWTCVTAAVTAAIAAGWAWFRERIGMS